VYSRLFGLFFITSNVPSPLSGSPSPVKASVPAAHRMRFKAGTLAH
jgi:hypothetical protein